ncbi:MAG: hypothetical protein JNK40_08860 [Chromatiales bacterium]|nr:hypothetical protein [Chromatiales bacterium]
MKKSSIVQAVHAVGISLILVTGQVEAAPAPGTATIQQLQKEVDELNRELDRLKGATSPDAGNQAMQRHWGMMQDHMRSTGQMPGMSAGGCANWQMMDPSLMGPGMMGPGMMGSGMAGCPMMGHGMGSGMMGSGMMGWAMPPGMTPDVYQKQMTEHMQTMRSQMTAIAAETDPTKRQALIRDHYNTMYQHMQTMRGMGWMWAPNAAASLPDAGSKGGKLVASYCSQCHAPPSPALHTRKEWSEVTTRMRAHIGDQGKSAGTGVKIPSAEELDTITTYLGEHARQ